MYLYHGPSRYATHRDRVIRLYSAAASPIQDMPD